MARWMSRRRAEDILAGRAGPDDPVARVISAAQATPEPLELAGLDAAVAAFGSAADSTTEPVSAPRATPTEHRVGTWLTGISTAVKIAIAVLLAAIAAAVAVLTAHRGRPPAAPPPPPVTSVHSVHRTPSLGSATSPGTPTGKASGGPSSGVPSTTSTPPSPSSGTTGATGAQSSGPESGSPHPSRAEVRQLCREWLAADVSARQSAKYLPLIAAAGGSGHVSAYCTGLLGGVATTPPPTRASAPTTARPLSVPHAPPTRPPSRLPTKPSVQPSR
jgi:hypothetical protein